MNYINKTKKQKAFRKSGSKTRRGFERRGAGAFLSE
jgi:hypothetical protein